MTEPLVIGPAVLIGSGVDGSGGPKIQSFRIRGQVRLPSM